MQPVKNSVISSCMATSCSTTLLWESEQKYQQKTRKLNEDPSVWRRAETEYCVGSSVRQHPEMRCGYRGKTSALPHRETTRRPVDQKSTFMIHIHIHIHRAGQHTKTETGDTQELNSEGNEKRRRQRESRVNSGADKKVR